MATNTTKRNRLAIATLLAVLASSALCVWGASALGLQVTSPILEAIFDGDPETTVSLGGEGGADVVDLASADADANAVAEVGNGQETGAGEATGEGTGESNGDSDADSDGDGSSGTDEGDSRGGSSASVDASSSNRSCFLNLICFTSLADVDADADTGLINASGVGLDVQAGVDANVSYDEGLALSADLHADGETTTIEQCQLLDLDGDVDLDADDDIRTQDDIELSALCDDIGFDVNLGAILGNDN